MNGACSAPKLFPGQRFEGRGSHAGFALTVLGYEPENASHYGMARVRIESLSDEALAHLRERAANNPHEPSRVSIAGYLAKVERPHEEERELAWFAHWLKSGLIAEVRS